MTKTFGENPQMTYRYASLKSSDGVTSIWESVEMGVRRNDIVMASGLGARNDEVPRAERSPSCRSWCEVQVEAP